MNELEKRYVEYKRAEAEVWAVVEVLLESGTVTDKNTLVNHPDHIRTKHAAFVALEAYESALKARGD